MFVCVVYDEWFWFIYIIVNVFVQVQMKEVNWVREGQMVEKRGKMVGDIMQVMESVREVLRRVVEVNKVIVNG